MEPVWITAAVIEWFVIMWLAYRLKDALADSAISAAAYERATNSWAAEVARLNGGSRIVSTPVSGPVGPNYLSPVSLTEINATQSTPQPYTFTGIPEVEQHLSGPPAYSDSEGLATETDGLEQASRYTYTGGVVDESVPND